MQRNTPSTNAPIARRGWIVLIIALLFASAPALAEGVAKQVSGLVEVGRGEPPVWAALMTGETIGSEDRVRTGADGRVEISMAAGTVRVHENSMLRLPPPEGDADQVRLETGHSLFDVLRRAGRRFEVHTPTVVVSVKGTRFGVDARGEVGEVIVYRGLVGVRESGVDNAIETLVREGFLAAGGSGVPIELDVAPSGDPWTGWQDFRSPVKERRGTPASLDDLGRAKQSLRKSTDADVIKRAAERKPEVAERLKKMQKTAGDKGEGVSNLPAAPMGDSDKDDGGKGRPMRHPIMTEIMKGQADETTKQEMKGQLQERQELMMKGKRTERDLDIDRLIDVGDMLGGGTFPGGNSDLDRDRLDELDPQALLTVMNALQIVQTQFESSAGNWTSSEVEDNLESALISLGIDPQEASNLVSDLINN